MSNPFDPSKPKPVRTAPPPHNNSPLRNPPTRRGPFKWRTDISPPLDLTHTRYCLRRALVLRRPDRRIPRGRTFSVAPVHLPRSRSGDGPYSKPTTSRFRTNETTRNWSWTEPLSPVFFFFLSIQYFHIETSRHFDFFPCRRVTERSDKGLTLTYMGEGSRRVVKGSDGGLTFSHFSYCGRLFRRSPGGRRTGVETNGVRFLPLSKVRLLHLDP